MLAAVIVTSSPSGTRRDPRTVRRIAEHLGQSHPVAVMWVALRRTRGRASNLCTKLSSSASDLVLVMPVPVQACRAEQGGLAAQRWRYINLSKAVLLWILRIGAPVGFSTETQGRAVRHQLSASNFFGQRTPQEHAGRTSGHAKSENISGNSHHPWASKVPSRSSRSL